MNKQAQIIVVIVVVVLIGWLLVHKKVASPAPIAEIPSTEIKDIQVPAPVPKTNAPIPRNVVLAKLPPSETVLSEKDNGKIFSIKMGQTFTISIKERVGGYDSISMSYKASVLDLTDHGFVPSTISGNLGSRIWTFKAIEEGTTDITIKATPNKGDSSQVIFSNTVEVTK